MARKFTRSKLKWTQHNGVLIRVCDMDTTHVMNSLALLVRRRLGMADEPEPTFSTASVAKLYQRLLRKREQHDRHWIAVFEQELKVREQEMVGDLDDIPHSQGACEQDAE